MKSFFGLVFSFYLTLFIPLLYLVELYLIVAFKNTILLHPTLMILGFCLAIVGISIWIASYFYLGFSFGVLPQKQKRVTKGLYGVFSHPMYGGIYVTFLGLSLTMSSLGGLLFLNLVITPMLFLRANAEEKALRS